MSAVETTQCANDIATFLFPSESGAEWGLDFAGCEDAIFAVDDVVSPRAPATLEDEFRGACREAVSFARRLPYGHVTPPPADLLDLAKRVLQQQQVLKDEDVQTWAERLAKEVADATD